MKLKHFHVIGNGSGEISPISSKTFTKVYFNVDPSPKESDYTDAIVIRSQRQKKEPHGKFTIYYAPNIDLANELEQKLNQTAYNLHRHLLAWPSSGLAFIKTVFDQAESIHIDRIGLDPSLQAPLSKAPKYSAPSTFHNWIAERRYVLEMIKKTPSEKFSWTSLMTTNHYKGFLNVKNPYELFERGFANKDIDAMQTALKTNFSNWESYLKQGDLFLNLEKKLFLQRGEKISSNWWLFDVQNSMLADLLSNLLRHHLNRVHCSGLSEIASNLPE